MGQTESLNRNIRVEMARAGFQQKDLARLSGLSSASISRKLAEHSDWTFTELVAVAKALDVPLSTLLPLKASA